MRVKLKQRLFTSILITSADDYNTAVGRYVAAAEDTVGKDNIVKYRKYIKDIATTDPQMAIIKSMRDGTGRFYHANPFFDLKTVSVSDDDTFLKRTALPYTIFGAHIRQRHIVSKIESC